MVDLSKLRRVLRSTNVELEASPTAQHEPTPPPPPTPQAQLEPPKSQIVQPEPPGQVVQPEPLPPRPVPPQAVQPMTRHKAVEVLRAKYGEKTVTRADVQKARDAFLRHIKILKSAYGKRAEDVAAVIEELIGQWAVPGEPVPKGLDLALEAYFCGKGGEGELAAAGAALFAEDCKRMAEATRGNLDAAVEVYASLLSALLQ